MKIIPFSQSYKEELLVLVQELREYIVSCDTWDDDLIVYDMKKEFEQEILSWYPNEEVYVYLAIEQEQVVGYIVASIKQDTWQGTQIKQYGKIEQLYIAKEMRWKWYATLLLKHCETILYKKGIAHLNIEVFADNSSAYHFYTKYGFVPRLISLAKHITPCP